MAKISNLAILDADVIISLHELGLWDKLMVKCNIYVAETVIKETMFYFKGDDINKRIPILLQNYVKSGEIKSIILDVSDLIDLRKDLRRFDAPDIDFGEMETIAAIHSGKLKNCFICLIDRAAASCAVLLGLRDSVISVENLLTISGLRRSVQNKLSDKRLQLIIRDAEIKRTCHL